MATTTKKTKPVSGKTTKQKKMSNTAKMWAKYPNGYAIAVDRSILEQD
jgi:hypothetical protein